MPHEELTCPSIDVDEAEKVAHLTDQVAQKGHVIDAISTTESYQEFQLELDCLE